MYWVYLITIVCFINFQTVGSCVGFWAGENYPFNETDYWNIRNTSIYTPELWSLFEKENIPIYLNVRYKRDFGSIPDGKQYFDDGLNIVKTANAKKIPIVAWLVVPIADGYWAHEGNPDIIKSAVEAFLEWIVKHNLVFRELVLDCETSYQDLVLLANILNVKTILNLNDTLNKLKVSTFFLERINPTSQCESTKKYAEIVALINQNGMSVSTGALPFVLEDLRNNDVALQDSLNISTASLIKGQKTIYNMAYRGGSTETTGVDPGPEWIKYFYLEGKKWMGTNTEVTLGIGGINPYDNLDNLIYDVRLLVGLGATHCPIYSLETTMARFDLTQLKQIVDAAANPLSSEEINLISLASTNVLFVFFGVLNQFATAQTLLKLETPNAYPGSCFET